MRAVADLRALPQSEPDTAVSEILGGSDAIAELRRAVLRAAPAPFNVVVEGESGSGKELVARALHRLGPRRNRPLCALNCAALSDTLLESELFGHVKGAFTGALQSRIGRFELAHGGTIFLDEVGELPPDIQVKLLRALQEQEFEPVGSNRTVRVDARVAAAGAESGEEHCGDDPCGAAVHGGQGNPESIQSSCSWSHVCMLWGGAGDGM